MSTSRLDNHTIARRLTLALSLFVLMGPACSSRKESAYRIIVINAPATGAVRRVLVAEGMNVKAGTPIIEIAVQNETRSTVPSPGESAETQAVRRLQATSTDIETARAEVLQHEAEVQRLTPLVASGEASQATLDGERALYERAQQRLQKAKDAQLDAQTGLLAARQPGKNVPAPAASEQIIAAHATAAGIVRVINARIGEHVTSGQPLATVSSDEP